MKVKELLREGFNILKNGNIDSYIIDTELILGKVLEIDRLGIILSKERFCSEEECISFYRYIEERRRKKPVKYITEAVEFMGIELFIKEGVLIPRPDTETLAEEVIKIIHGKGYKKVCDLCCGSGALGISLAKSIDEVELTFFDISMEACMVTEINIKRQSLGKRAQVFKSDLLEKALEEGKKFDVIVCNPPYIKTEEIPNLMEDVKEYEPFEALCGGRDGLDFYRKISLQGRDALIEGGLLSFEIGCDQFKAVEEIMLQYGYTDIHLKRDLAGKDRVVLGFR